MDKAALQRRAEVAFWGCLACAQPWLVVDSKMALVWAGAAVVAWFLARKAD